MTTANSVVVTVDVPVAPDEAFRQFTEEIDRWYRKDRNTMFDVDRAVAIRFEPFPGGRLLEVYDEATGDGREIARVTTWAPGSTLVFVDNHSTEVEVNFIEISSGTRLTLEHRHLDRVPRSERDQVRRFGWRIVVPWFAGYLASRS